MIRLKARKVQKVILVTLDRGEILATLVPKVTRASQARTAKMARTVLGAKLDRKDR